MVFLYQNQQVLSKQTNNTIVCIILQREVLVIPPLWALYEDRGRYFSCLSPGRKSFTLHTLVLWMCKLSVRTWLVEMMIVVTLCRLRASA